MKSKPMKIKVPSAMQDAFIVDDFEAMKDLILKGLDPNTVDQRDEGTALMRAAVKNDPDFAKFLIDHGANVNQTNKAKWTALHFAAQDINVEIVCMLLDAGADVNAQESNGNTVLAIALGVRMGDFMGLARLLIERGADKHIKNNYDMAPADVYSDVLDKL